MNSLTMKPAKPKTRKARGSTARRLKSHSRGVRSNTPATPTRILVPIDFSPPSMQALHTAAGFARQYGGRITLLHILEPPRLPRVSTYVSVVKLGVSLAELETQLAELGRKHIDPEHFETARVETGSPFEEIVAAARALNTDVIIIATHGYTGLRRVLLGSTAERVIRYSPCPVLTVRQDQRQNWPVGDR